MKKCIIFGAGMHGNLIYYKLEKYYDIAAYSDNSEKLWGSKIHNLTVIPPQDILQYSDVIVVVCVEDYCREIAIQLSGMGIKDIIIAPNGVMYDYQSGKVMPILNSHKSEYFKKNDDKLSVLYVQPHPCARTKKIASALKNVGVNVHSAYFLAPAENNTFNEEHCFWTFEELFDFVKNSEFDVIHCSNTPDSFTNVLIHTGKKIIHDTHDMASMFCSLRTDSLSTEFISNIFADGCIVTSEEVADILTEKYNLPQSKVLVLENFPQSAYKLNKSEKLSEIDNELHCVYMWQITSTIRYDFEVIWTKISDAGVHIHFYSAFSETHCQKYENINPKYIHYEGFLKPQEFADILPKYDCGLAFWNIASDEDATFLDTASPNKRYDYLAAGLPIVVNNLNSQRKFTEKYNCGGVLDLSGDIQEQLREISAKKIALDFIQINNMTMDSQTQRIINFYREIIEK
ncbi:MAG: glycosyltransferase [Oscillospiraceae bacterium]|jgi:hypothetical protein|nr:glycosyltransferase [Oscillospiraceae bacterium]